MPISAVSSPSSATSNAVQQPKPQQAEARKPERTDSGAEAAKARQPQQQAAKPEQAKPVVNAEGQKTGQVISVTA